MVYHQNKSENLKTLSVLVKSASKIISDFIYFLLDHRPENANFFDYQKSLATPPPGTPADFVTIDRSPRQTRRRRRRRHHHRRIPQLAHSPNTSVCVSRHVIVAAVPGSSSASLPPPACHHGEWHE